MLKENIGSSLLLFNDILNKGFDGHHFIVGLGEHLRNLLVCKDESTLILLEVGENTKEQYKEYASKLSAMELMAGIQLCNTCDVQYKTNKNPRLLVELALMKLCSLKSTLKKKVIA